ncbi:EamA family transporter [Labrys wisconsinensis]|uniref:Blue pigment (Indigoidine) exporter n=1 Tax=Labrys wisconsinensis TaxID=425677 RepID=A0ABU0JLA1_9HYPH|nr:EamA family transporter [Labrys wisconsinensis]MDQ0475076.1 putative blue pigment (indigoidine) exporter [Labrys wisconsinensis]
MAGKTDLVLTALAPAIWGSTYLVTTELLPPGRPLTVALLRALPAGVLLLAVVRQWPHGIWWVRSLLLGALNFSLFWWMLFVAAYRLPGGVAATVGAVQPLLVIGLARLLLGTPVRLLSVVAAVAGLAGVALLILTDRAALDPVGVAAGLAGAASMAAGTVLSRRWQPPASPLAFAAWQLTAGGLLLLPAALWLEPPPASLSLGNVAGFAYLGLVGAALTYVLWFRGIARLEPAAVSSLGFLSPATAVVLGWLVLGQRLSPAQGVGMVLVLGSVWLAQRAQRAAAPVSPAGAAPVPGRP